MSLRAALPDDPNLVSVATFHKLAERYAEKYFALDHYDRFYQLFAGLVPEQQASILDIACGPGNVAAYLARVRPDFSVVGVDLAENMIEQARTRVPSAEFHVMDCRELGQLKRTFHGAAFAFGLNYLSDADADNFFRSLDTLLRPDGVLLLTSITGHRSHAGYECSSTGDRVFMVYRTPFQIRRLVQSHGYDIVHEAIVPSPSNASTQTSDLILLATRSDGET